MSTHSETSVIPVNSIATLESLVGARIVGEVPEVDWADSHGHFQFETEAEAQAAVHDPYYQQFLPLWLATTGK